jgi:hypothetical protein
MFRCQAPCCSPPYRSDPDVCYGYFGYFRFFGYIPEIHGCETRGLIEGLRVYDFEFRVQVSGLKIESLGLRV